MERGLPYSCDSSKISTYKGSEHKMLKFSSFVYFSHPEIALSWCNKWIRLINKSEIKNMLIICFNDNLASGDPSRFSMI